MSFTHSEEPNRIIEILIGGLRALRIMQDRAELEEGAIGLFPPPSDTEIDALIRALNDRRLRLASGVSNVVTFKRAVKEAPCNR